MCQSENTMCKILGESTKFERILYCHWKNIMCAKFRKIRISCRIILKASHQELEKTHSGESGKKIRSQDQKRVE